MTSNTKLREFHAARWGEPVLMEMSRAGRRGTIFPEAEPGVSAAVGDADGLIPAEMRRKEAPALPEMSEPDVLRHYVHLSQETMGMVGISLFGTCTMKYNPRVNEIITSLPQVAEVHPRQDEDALQGVLEIIYGMDKILREVSGMDQFVFQAGGGADASYTHACVTRAYHASRGELEKRNEIITTIQTHPCNPATAATAGFKVINLMLDENVCTHSATSQDAVTYTYEADARFCVDGGAVIDPAVIHLDGTCDGLQPRRHGHLQPRDQGVDQDRPRRGRALLLRPRQLQRGHG